MNLEAEVFPVNESALPPLRAFALQGAGPRGPAGPGGQLAFRFRHLHGHHWVWADGHIVTDHDLPVEDLSPTLFGLWKSHPEEFRAIEGLRADPSWRPTPATVAEFVARGILPEYAPESSAALRRYTRQVGDLRVERILDRRRWVVRARPAVSLSVRSLLTHRMDLAEFARTEGRSDEHVGLEVVDRTSDLRGLVSGIVGRVAEHRARLLELTPRPEMIELIEQAPPEELVVQVDTGRHLYDYVASALKIVVSPAEAPPYGLARTEALALLRIPPTVREQMVQAAARPMVAARLLLPNFAQPYAAIGTFVRQAGGPMAHIRFGEARETEYRPVEILATLARHGVFRRAATGEARRPLGIGVLEPGSGRGVGSFLTRLRGRLAQSGFPNEVRFREAPSRWEEPAIRECLARARSPPDLLLGIVPARRPAAPDARPMHDPESVLFRVALDEGLPLQVVPASHLANGPGLAEAVVGSLSKLGHVPYVLSPGLESTDYVIGLDLVRPTEGGSLAFVVSRLYRSDGALERSVIAPTAPGPDPLGGAFRQALPEELLRGRRAFLHHMGAVPPDERRALLAHLDRIELTGHLLEVLDHGVPRLYGNQPGRIGAPPRGSAFLLSDGEAFLVTSTSEFETDATPRPLYVRSEGPFGLTQALRSLLLFGQLHYGRLKGARLPVTLHRADEVAAALRAGAQPPARLLSTPFWL